MRFSISARSGDDTTPIGVPPPFSTYWTAYPPMPPVAPQMSTLSPCFIRAPCSPTSMRYEVELHSALTADSSHVRWVGLGISWFALTMLRSASPPKFVSKPQIRWLAASIESLCADGSWSST